MKKLTIFLLCLLVSLGRADVVVTVPSGTTNVFAAGATLTLSGTLNGTPSGGVLDLSHLTLTLPPGAAGGSANVTGFRFSNGAGATDTAGTATQVAALLSGGTGTLNLAGYTLNLTASQIPSLDWAKITTGKPTTLSGYGITDAQPLDSDLTAIAALSTTPYGRALLALANQGQLDTALNLGYYAHGTDAGQLTGTLDPARLPGSLPLYTTGGDPYVTFSHDGDLGLTITDGWGQTIDINSDNNGLTLNMPLTLNGSGGSIYDQFNGVPVYSGGALGPLDAGQLINVPPPAGLSVSEYNFLAVGVNAAGDFYVGVNADANLYNGTQVLSGPNTLGPLDASNLTNVPPPAGIYIDPDCSIASGSLSSSSNTGAFDVGNGYGGATQILTGPNTLGPLDGSALKVGGQPVLGSPVAPTITSDGNVVTITHADPNVTLRYTVDGATPTVASTLYAAPFAPAAGSHVIRAVAFATPPGATGTYTATIAGPQSETTAYAAAVTSAGGTMTSARQTAINTFVVAAKAHGYWSHLLDVWSPATDAFAGALVKLRNYTGTGTSLTNTGFVSGDYAAANGLTGASGKYLDTGFNYQTYGTSVMGSAVYFPTSGAGTFGTKTALGNATGRSGGAGVPFNLIGLLPGPTFYDGTNGGLTAGGVGGAGRGFYHEKRSSLTSGKAYINGTLVSTNTGTLTDGPQNVTQKIFAAQNSASNNATVTGNFVGPLSFYAVDDGTMTDAQAASYAADVTQLQRDLGRIVPLGQVQEMAFLVGQSLATGANGNPSLSSSQPYSNRLLNTAGVNATFYPLNFVPLTEGFYETPASGFANQQAALWRVDHAGDSTRDLTLSNFATGGAPYAYMKKGGYGGGYAEAIAAVTNAKNLGVDYCSGGIAVPGIICVHGESDANSSTYAADIAQWQSDFEGDIKAITGQSGTIPMFHSQISAWTATGNMNEATAVGPIQQLAAYEANPSKTILVCPKYIFQYGTGTNDVHLTAVGYRWLGEYYGKVWDAVSNRSGTWSPLRPTNISRSGAVITVTMTSGTGTSGVVGGNLVLDTTSVTSPNGAADGFEWSQTGGTAQTISSVSVSGSTVTITLSGDPGAGSTNRLRYAYTGVAGNAGGPTTGPRGCLRDSDPAVGVGSGNHLYNWCVTFDKSCP